MKTNERQVDGERFFFYVANIGCIMHIVRTNVIQNCGND